VQPGYKQRLLMDIEHVDPWGAAGSITCTTRASALVVGCLCRFAACQFIIIDGVPMATTGSWPPPPQADGR